MAQQPDSTSSWPGFQVSERVFPLCIAALFLRTPKPFALIMSKNSVRVCIVCVDLCRRRSTTTTMSNVPRACDGVNLCANVDKKKISHAHTTHRNRENTFAHFSWCGMPTIHTKCVGVGRDLICACMYMCVSRIWCVLNTLCRRVFYESNHSLGVSSGKLSTECETFARSWLRVCICTGN